MPLPTANRFAGTSTIASSLIWCREIACGLSRRVRRWSGKTKAPVIWSPCGWVADKLIDEQHIIDKLDLGILIGDRFVPWPEDQEVINVKNGENKDVDTICFNDNSVDATACEVTETAWLVCPAVAKGLMPETEPEKAGVGQDGLSSDGTLPTLGRFAPGLCPGLFTAL